MSTDPSAVAIIRPCILVLRSLAHRIHPEDGDNRQSNQCTALCSALAQEALIIRLTWSISMKKNFIAYGIVAILLGSASLVSVAFADNTALVNRSGNVSYVSGGVGTESLDQLRSMTREFNLKLVFALNSGEFLSDVRVHINDAKGKTVLDAKSEGPWFLTRLPAGNYQVVATLAGKPEKRQIDVTATGLRTIDFRWKSE